MGQRILKMRFESIARYLASGFHAITVVDGLPPDAKVKSMGHDEFGRLNILLESPTWSDIPDGEAIPTLEPKFTLHSS